ncbi:MAG TPA: type II CAAX endopeptidase family protein [Dictyoglomaceae bacterium]|nr:type II CAAX endopeptidase family protein [Dictyoglomaceae bacterium]HOL39779.1 type II CAAX endopeptidase family protein [Dictyoglomaceae bacterium]HPP16241.1 type II CAAX endopeptidase family protein [Dictyoglomaceae bacterium]HPU43470.1 type II CAAX endopeptidase family protein [Dictyoglomaceae bacterium]
MEFVKAIWSILWRVSLFLISWGLLYAPFIIPVRKYLEEQDSVKSIPLRLYMESMGMISIIIASLIMVSFVEHKPFWYLGFSPKNMMKDSFMGILLGSGIFIISIILLWVLGYLKLYREGEIIWSVLLLSGIAMLLNTITQELLVRGYIFQVIRENFGVLASIILSSMIFSILHLSSAKGNILAMLNIFLIGVLFGYTRAVTDGLWMPIGIHFAWNFLLGPVIGLTVSGKELTNSWRFFTLQGPNIFSGGNFGIEGGLSTTFSIVIFLILLYKIL